MSGDASPPDEETSDAVKRNRAKRIVELVYSVAGVTTVRLWSEDDRIAVGVRGNDVVAPSDLVARVKSALAGIAHAGETIEVGILGDDPIEPTPEASP